MARNHGPSRRRDHADAFLPDPASGSYRKISGLSAIDDMDFTAREQSSPAFDLESALLHDDGEEATDHSVIPPPL